jgi:hypothetical protein
MEYASETSGLALYQQTVNQTAGIPSSVWVESTGVRPAVLAKLIPIETVEKDKEPLEEKTA